MRSGSVVVDEFDILGTSFPPHETQAPLRVHAEAELPAAITYQPLPAIARRYSQVLEILRRVDQGCTAVAA